MASKHPYLDQELKGAFLEDLDRGDVLLPTAKRLKINPKTARSIKERSDHRIANHDPSLPPLSLHERACRAPKVGKHHILSEIDINTLDQGIRVDRESRDIYQFDVAQALHLPGSRSTIWRAVQKAGIHRVKHTKKLALTFIQEAERYEIALGRKRWKARDWKRIIYSDEASIVVGAHRGSQNTSRKPDERYNPDCIEVRYNKYSEAMFWGCCSYNFKGPCYVYLKETPAQRKQYLEIITSHNSRVLPQIQEDWERWQAADAMKWLSSGRRKPGVEKKWENFKQNHNLWMARTAKRGGVDNMRYIYEVLKPLLIPFIQRLNKERAPGTPTYLFQQDNAPSHTSKWTLQALEEAGIEVLEHPGNSPDMNAIEGVWMPLRIAITQVWERPHTLEWTNRAWRAEWVKFPQKRIHKLIIHQKKIMQEILLDQGGNHFHG